MSSASAINHLKTLALASVVAVLVWIFAEGEGLQPRPVDLSVIFPTDASSAVVIRPDDKNFRGSVRVSLEATSRSLDLAAPLLAAGIRLSPGAPGVPSEPGEQRIVDLREAIGAMPQLKSLGVTVADVQPRQVVVQIIRMAGKDLPLRVELGAEVPLDGDPTPVPSTVSIRLPEPALALIPEGAVAIAAVSEAEVHRIRGEGPQTVTATVRLPSVLSGVEPIVVQPETVTVNLRVRRKVETYKVSTVPVWYSLPPTEDGSKWSVEVLDKFLTDVTLTGPSDEIARVRTTGPNQITVKALVELSSDDLQNGVTTKQVTFPGLPPSLVPSGNATTVRVKIGRRAETGPPK